MGTGSFLASFISKNRGAGASGVAQDIPPGSGGGAPIQDALKGLLEELEVMLPGGLVRHLCFVPDQHNLDALVVPHNVACHTSCKSVLLLCLNYSEFLCEIFLLARQNPHMDSGGWEFTRMARWLPGRSFFLSISCWIRL